MQRSLKSPSREIRALLEPGRAERWVGMGIV